MKLIEFNWHPTHRQLRQFGLICLVALPALAWFWGWDASRVQYSALAGAVIAGLGWILPVCLKPLFLAASIVATPIGMVIGELAMLVIYYGIFMPFALVFRMLGRDPLQIRADRPCDSYWLPKRKPARIGSYYRQS